MMVALVLRKVMERIKWRGLLFNQLEGRGWCFLILISINRLGLGMSLQIGIPRPRTSHFYPLPYSKSLLSLLIRWNLAIRSWKEFIMSINPISSASTVYAPQGAQSAPPQKPVQNQSSGQDTVQLSKAALAAAKGGGDADHDGDSH